MNWETGISITVLLLLAGCDATSREQAVQKFDSKPAASEPARESKSFRATLHYTSGMTVEAFGEPNQLAFIVRGTDFPAKDAGVSFMELEPGDAPPYSPGHAEAGLAAISQPCLRKRR